MKKKFYAVRKGRVPGIYTTWDEAKAQVTGFSGAAYKSFAVYEEAEAFMREDRGKAEEKTPQELVTEDRSLLVAYVDGSYAGGDAFAYGMVLLSGEGEKKAKGRITDPELAAMHNVAGEIKGAEAAMRYALDNGFKKLIIYHDYEGIAKWCLGEWRTNREGTKAYKAFYDSIRDTLDISFEKVTGHSGDYYNEMADQLAKAALGIGKEE